MAGEWLLVPTHEAGRAPAWSRLRWLGLADGQLHRARVFESALISGLAVAPGRGSEGLTLVATYSTASPGDQGALLALDTAGQAVWRWSPGVPAVSAPVLAGETAWVTTNTGRLVALEVASGREQTRLPLDRTPALSAPTLAEGVAYIPCRGPYLLAVGLAGQPGWQFQAETARVWLDKSPVVVGDLVVAILNLGGAVVALRASDGRPAWQVSLGPPGKPLSPPSTDGERLYVGTRAGLHALDPANGQEVWRFAVSRGLEAAPVVVGGVVYIAGRNHHLYALDAASGRELWPPYEVERRIEVPPLITSGARPQAIIADRGGTVTTLQRPLSAAEHEATGHWLEAASAYAALGQLSRGAALFEAQAEPFKAAQLWQATGKLEQAAGQYEIARAWARAAELWQQLNRPLKQAEALEQYVRSLSSEATSDETLAKAWESAGRAFAVAGASDRAEACQREVVRYRRLPYLEVEVEHEGLLLNAWTRLRFIVHNRGHGLAHHLIIRAYGGQFEGQVAETRQIISLPAGQRQEDWLDVRPLAYGDSVPLRVSINYQDGAGNDYPWEKTIYLLVAQPGERPPVQEKQPAGRGATRWVLDASRVPLGPIRQRWALLVGINRYVDSSFAPLKFCVNDVVVLAETLKKVGYTVVTLHDEAPEARLQPDNENIEAELVKLCQVAQAEDLLWVHFAGHGQVHQGRPLLITKRTRRTTLAKTGLPLAEVEKQMRASAARRLVLTLDACHVGVEIGRRGSDPEFIRHAHDLAEGFAMIAASTAQQQAQEWEKKKHGVFTYYLLAGLTGQAARQDNRFVTMDDLKTYILDSLRRWSVENDGLIQEPSARAEGLGDMILADYRTG